MGSVWLRGPTRWRVAAAATLLAAGALSACGEERPRWRPGQPVSRELLWQSGKSYLGQTLAERRALARLCRGRLQLDSALDPAQLQAALDAHWRSAPASQQLIDGCRAALSRMKPIRVSVKPASFDKDAGAYVFDTRRRGYHLRGRVEPFDGSIDLAIERKRRGRWEAPHAVVLRGHGRFDHLVRLAPRSTTFRLTALDGLSPRHQIVVRILSIRPGEHVRLTVRRRRAPEDFAKTLFLGGEGTRNLGDLKLPKPMTLRWQHEGGPFRVRDDRFRLRAASDRDEGGGTVALEARTYERVTVRASGHWLLELEAR